MGIDQDMPGLNKHGRELGIASVYRCILPSGIDGMVERSEKTSQCGNFFFIIIFFRERGEGAERDRDRERENLKQTPCSVQSPTWVSILRPWDHDLS